MNISIYSNWKKHFLNIFKYNFFFFLFKGIIIITLSFTNNKKIPSNSLWYGDIHLPDFSASAALSRHGDVPMCAQGCQCHPCSGIHIPRVQEGAGLKVQGHPEVPAAHGARAVQLVKLPALLWLKAQPDLNPHRCSGCQEPLLQTCSFVGSTGTTWPWLAAGTRWDGRTPMD